jgi:hypothetical protein
MWVNSLTESWMTIDEELPQQMRQTVGTTTSMLTVFQSEGIRHRGFITTERILHNGILRE